MTTKGDTEGHYDALGVNPDAEQEVIRAAYRALAGKYHPDQNPNDREAAERKLKRLNAAYAQLGEPDQRRAYDLRQARTEPRSAKPPPAPPREEPPRQRSPGPRAAAQQSGDDRRTAAPAEAANDKKPHTAGARALVAVFAIGMSLWASPPHENERDASLVGQLLGCLLLAWLVYWLARKIRPVILAMGLALIAAISASLRNDQARHDREASAAATPAARTPAPTATASAQWVWTTRPGYAIAFPDTPRPLQPASIAIGGGTAKNTGFDLSRPSGAYYAVQEWDYPAGSAISEQRTIDDVLKAARVSVPNQTVTIASDRRAMIGHCNGRDIAVTADTLTARHLFCVMGSRSYMALAAIPKTATASDVSEAASFLGSFAPTTSPVAAPKPTSGGSPRAANSATQVDGGQCNCNGDLVCQMNCAAPPSAALSPPPPAPTPQPGSELRVQ